MQDVSLYQHLKNELDIIGKDRIDDFSSGVLVCLKDDEDLIAMNIYLNKMNDPDPNEILWYALYLYKKRYAPEKLKEG